MLYQHHRASRGHRFMRSAFNFSGSASSGNFFSNPAFATFHCTLAAASRRFSSSVVRTPPVVCSSVFMNEMNPVTMHDADHAGFQLSWCHCARTTHTHHHSSVFTHTARSSRPFTVHPSPRVRRPRARASSRPPSSHLRHAHAHALPLGEPSVRRDHAHRRRRERIRRLKSYAHHVPPSLVR